MLLYESSIAALVTTNFTAFLLSVLTVLSHSYIGHKSGMAWHGTAGVSAQGLTRLKSKYPGRLWFLSGTQVLTVIGCSISLLAVSQGTPLVPLVFELGPLHLTASKSMLSPHALNLSDFIKRMYSTFKGSCD